MPWGSYRYKRLAFGGKNSQDLFDAEIAKIISGIPHVLNNRDDIMVEGKDWEEHTGNGTRTAHSPQHNTA